MQRATGQYDRLARIPGTGPRQSSGRGPFASRHWCRTTPRRARGMEPTVRRPRIESAYPLQQGLSLEDIAKLGNWLFDEEEFDTAPKLFPALKASRQAHLAEEGV